MTYTVNEAVNRREQPTPEKAIRVFNAVGTSATPVVSATAALMAVDSSTGMKIPPIYEPHPDDASMVVTSIIPRMLPGGERHWLMECVYTILPLQYPEDADEGGDGGSDEFYSRVNIDYKTDFEDQWRSCGMTLPPKINEPVRGDDIGGQPIDSMGVPTSVGIRKAVLTITEQYADLGINPVIAGMENKRNSSIFMGAEPGKLVYIGGVGTNVNRYTWEVTHRFAWDDWYHLRQVPEREVDGKPKLNTTIYTDAPDGVDVPIGEMAQPVFFVQPYPTTGDFTQLGINLE